VDAFHRIIGAAMLRGICDPEALPTPEIAREFLNNAVYCDGAIERPAALPEFCRTSSSTTTGGASNKEA
jgi:hypothetical protein